MSVVFRYRLRLHGRRGEPGRYRLRHHLPVQPQGLRQGVLDHWGHDDWDQSRFELDQAHTQGADWRSLRNERFVFLPVCISNTRGCGHEGRRSGFSVMIFCAFRFKSQLQPTVSGPHFLPCVERKCWKYVPRGQNR